MLSAISFFLFVLLTAALAVRFLWNRLAADVPRLPTITFGKSMAVVMAWGLFALVVLTMIATTRELMMPGSWRTVGLLYRAPSEPNEGVEAAEHHEQAPLATGVVPIVREILLGWFDFLHDRVSRAQIDGRAIVHGLAIFSLFLVLTDAFARRCCRVRGAARDSAPRWRFRWSLAILTTLVLMFVVAYASIGLARHVGWLMSG